eukprot:6012504-Alexandrium_andersonii.AAC.1
MRLHPSRGWRHPCRASCDSAFTKRARQRSRHAVHRALGHRPCSVRPPLSQLPASLRSSCPT